MNIFEIAWLYIDENQLHEGSVSNKRRYLE